MHGTSTVLVRTRTVPLAVVQTIVLVHVYSCHSYVRVQLYVVGRVECTRTAHEHEHEYSYVRMSFAVTVSPTVLDPLVSTPPPLRSNQYCTLRLALVLVQALYLVGANSTETIWFCDHTRTYEYDAVGARGYHPNRH